MFCSLVRHISLYSLVLCPRLGVLMYLYGFLCLLPPSLCTWIRNHVNNVIPSDLDSHLIYHFKCPSCNAGYVGETRVPHIVRNCQHLGISPYTGKPMKGGVPTSVTKHISAKKCKCSLENFSIIGRESDYHRRLIKESLFIKLYNYELNGQETSTESNLWGSSVV